MFKMATLRLNDWRMWIEQVTCVPLLGLSFIRVATFKIRRKNSPRVSTFCHFIRSFMWPHRLKSRCLKSGDMGAKDSYHHDQSTDEGSNDRDTFSVLDQNGVALRRVANIEAMRCTDTSHFVCHNSCKRQLQWTDTSYMLDSQTCQDAY
jgi:hypothetical protein